MSSPRDDAESPDLGGHHAPGHPVLGREPRHCPAELGLPALGVRAGHGDPERTPSAGKPA